MKKNLEKKSSVNQKKVSTAIVLASLEKQAKPIINKLSKLDKIKDNDDYDKAVELTKDLKGLGKAAKAELDTILKPLKEASDAARKHFKPFQDNLYQIEQGVKALLLEYQETLDKKKEKLEADFEEGNIKRASTFMRKAGELENDNNVRRVYKAVCIDERKTPREYLTPDVTKIREALKAGKKVAGWAWEQEKTIAI